MRTILIAVLTAGLLAPATGGGAELIARILDDQGQPVADAVLLVEAQPGTVIEAPAGSRLQTIDQRDETFLPYVQTFRPGDRVVFQNSDQTAHHVYSFSPVKEFEMVLHPGDRSEPLSLDGPGVVVVGCNIHDYMIAHLYVSESGLMAQADAEGVARVDGLTEGGYTVQVWHPRLRPGQEQAITRTLELDAADAIAEAAFTLELWPDPRSRRDRVRLEY